MIKKANMSISGKQLAKMVKTNKVTFENAVQRGFVWDNKRKSLLIHSMIAGYPIPPFYARKDENGSYDMLDGKQRSNAIAGYINGEYALSDIPYVTLEEVEEKQENEIDISDKKFEELPEEIQDAIKDYSLTVYYFDGITDDEVQEMFTRLNNGKPLSAIELTRVKAKSLETIVEIGKHEIFEKSLSEKAINGYKNEDVIIKSYKLMYDNNKSLETKQVRPFTESMDITPEQRKILESVFNRIVEVHDTILLNDNSKRAQRIAKRIYTRTHMISIVPIIKKSIEDNVDMEKVADWLNAFFNGSKSASIDDNYNSNIIQGANKEISVKARLEALENSYNQSKIAYETIEKGDKQQEE